MTFLALLILHALVIGHAILEAYREYMFYHIKAWHKNSELPWTRDEHNSFALQRIVFFLPVVWVLWYLPINPDARICFVFGMAAVWYVMHEGMYYYFRNKANPLIYQNGFWANNVEDEEENSDIDWDSKLRKSILGFGVLMSLSGFFIELLNHA